MIDKVALSSRSLRQVSRDHSYLTDNCLLFTVKSHIPPLQLSQKFKAEAHQLKGENFLVFSL
jgi:hypothetical protein